MQNTTLIGCALIGVGYILNSKNIMKVEPHRSNEGEYMAEEADFYTVAYMEEDDDSYEVDDDYDNLNKAMSAYQHFINQGMDRVVIAGYNRIDAGGYEENTSPVAEYLKNGYDNRPIGYS